MADLFESTDGLIKALKVSQGEAVMITLPISDGFDHSNIDKLAFQVRRSWPGVPVLIVSGDIEVAVIEYPRVPAGVETDLAKHPRVTGEMPVNEFKEEE